MAQNQDEIFVGGYSDPDGTFVSGQEKTLSHPQTKVTATRDEGRQNVDKRSTKTPTETGFFGQAEIGEATIGEAEIREAVCLIEE